MIQVTKKNEAFLKIEAPDTIVQTLSKSLTTTIPGFQYTPAFKNSKGKWDGSVRLFNSLKGELLYGHLQKLIQIAEEQNEKISFGKGVIDTDTITIDDLHNLLDNANLPSKFERRDYQLRYAAEALSRKKVLIESPTGSGKSFIMYMICLKLLYAINNKIAIIVPRTSLVEQLYSDFADYGMDVERYCGRIYAKYNDSNPKKKIYITTWQSIAKEKPDYFNQFGAVIGDEAHGFKAKSLRHIMENCINASYRIGLTGTVPKEVSSKILIEGLLGPKFTIENTDTTALIKQGYLNRMEPIKIVVLQYTNQERKLHKSTKYQEEIDFIINHERRNKYLKELTKSLKGNTLLLFSRVETHGKPLFNSMKESINKNVYYISGEVETDDREQIRKIMANESDAVIIASMGTFSTGVNIPNLDNLILGYPTKKDITVLQMIGRVLRLSSLKTRVFDIVDDLSWNGNHNYAMRHALERIKIYASKDFEYEIETISI